MRSIPLLSSTVTLLLTIASPSTAKLPVTGKVNLFSDSACSQAPYSNAAIIGRDFCAQPDSARSYNGGYGSFILNERPWCGNGSRPYFNIFADELCARLVRSYPAGPLYMPTGPDADGSCVRPPGGERFRAMAFVCDGFDRAWGVGGGGGDDDDGTTAISPVATTTSAFVLTDLPTLSQISPIPSSVTAPSEPSASVTDSVSVSDPSATTGTGSLPSASTSGLPTIPTSGAGVTKGSFPYVSFIVPVVLGITGIVVV